MDVPRYYRLKMALFRCFPLPRADQDPSSKWLRLRRRILTLAFDHCDGYFSQFGQDKFVDQVIFAGETGGVFLDVGAYDGVTINNTYFLEQSRHWTGICIEPQPAAFAKLQKARTAICVNGCAGLHDGNVDFLQVYAGNEMLSGRTATFEPGDLARIEAAAQRSPTRAQVVQARSLTLPGLLRAHGIAHVDFLSLDTEGGELDLLRSLDLGNLGVRAISVENNSGRQDIECHLAHAGYQLVAFMGCDEIYRRSDDIG